jgi:peptidoglycan hydrolase CwlO-like protein
MTLFFMSNQDIQHLLQAYQNKVSDLLSQVIAFEARIMSQQEIINNLQHQLETTQVNPKSTNRKVNTEKSDSGEF